MCCDSLISRPAQLGNSEKSPTEYLKLLASTLAHQCSLESLSWLSREIVSKRTYLARGRASGRSRLSAEPKHTTRRPFPSATSARCSNSNPTELKWRLLKIEKRRQWTTDDDFRIREVSKCLHWSVIIHDAAFDVSMLWHTSASPDVNRATDRQQLQSWPCLYVTSAGRCASSSWACLGMQLTSVSPSQRNAMFHSASKTRLQASVTDGCSSSTACYTASRAAAAAAASARCLADRSNTSVKLGGQAKSRFAVRWRLIPQHNGPQMKRCNGQ